jgi:hypothetical protein
MTNIIIPYTNRRSNDNPDASIIVIDKKTKKKKKIKPEIIEIKGKRYFKYNTGSLDSEKKKVSK